MFFLAPENILSRWQLGSGVRGHNAPKAVGQRRPGVGRLPHQLYLQPTAATSMFAQPAGLGVTTASTASRIRTLDDKEPVGT